MRLSIYEDSFSYWTDNYGKWVLPEENLRSSSLRDGGWSDFWEKVKEVAKADANGPTTSDVAEGAATGALAGAAPGAAAGALIGAAGAILGKAVGASCTAASNEGGGKNPEGKATTEISSSSGNSQGQKNGK